MFSRFLTNHVLPERYLASAEEFYIPLAKQIANGYQQRQAEKNNSTFFVGVNGCQGSGKSTLVDFLALYLKHQFKLTVVSLSLDDFYLSCQQREDLALRHHPLLKTRGVPATHNVKLLKSVLTQLKNSKTNQQAICLPKFDKAQDNPIAQKNWQRLNAGVDIVLFEGWCWGVTSQYTDELAEPVNELEAKHDPNGDWRRHVNESLLHDYQPLYSFIDTWLMLKAPSFTVTYQWRLEQEQKLAAKMADSESGGSSVMSVEEVATFVQYFQRLTEHALNNLPSTVDVLFELNENREIIASEGLSPC